MAQYVSFHDLLAAVVTVILLLAIIVFVFADKAVPEYVTIPFGSAMGWALRGGVQLQNELRHRNRSNNES